METTIYKMNRHNIETPCWYYHMGLRMVFDVMFNVVFHVWFLYGFRMVVV